MAQCNPHVNQKIQLLNASSLETKYMMKYQGQVKKTKATHSQIKF